MRILLLISFLLISFNVMTGCTTNTPYPDQWPKLLKNPDGACSNISGDYCDMYHDRYGVEQSLTHLLVYGGKSPENDEEAEHTIALATHVIIIQSQKTIELEIMNEKKLLFVKTLTFGKDIFCADGPYIAISGQWCMRRGPDVPTGLRCMLRGCNFWGSVFDFEKCYLLPAEDGSLIILHTSGGCGCGVLTGGGGCGTACIPFPVTGSDKHYHRVKRYTSWNSKFKIRLKPEIKSRAERRLKN